MAVFNLHWIGILLFLSFSLLSSVNDELSLQIGWKEQIAILMMGRKLNLVSPGMLPLSIMGTQAAAIVSVKSLQLYWYHYMDVVTMKLFSDWMIVSLLEFLFLWIIVSCVMFISHQKNIQRCVDCLHFFYRV